MLLGHHVPHQGAIQFLEFLYILKLVSSILQTLHRSKFTKPQSDLTASILLFYHQSLSLSVTHHSDDTSPPGEPAL